MTERSQAAHSVMDDAQDPAFSSGAGAGSLNRRSAVGVLIATSSQGARFLIQFGSMMVLARLLQPWQFGLVAMISPIMSLLYAFADIGLAQAIVQRRGLSRPEVSSVFWLVCLISSLLAAGLAIASPLVAAFYREPRLVPILLVFAGVLAVSGTAIVPRALLTRQTRFGAMAAIDVSSALIGASAGITAALLGAGYWALVVTGAASIVASTILGWILCRWRPGLVMTWRKARPFVGAGSYLAVSNAATLLTASLDSVMIGGRLGAAPLGIYDQGFRLVNQSVAQLISPVARVVGPLFVRARHQDEDYSATFIGAIRMLCLVLWPGLVAAACVADWVVGVVLGGQWHAAAPVVAWFCIVAMCAPLYQGAGWLFLAEGRLRAQAIAASLVLAAVGLCVLASLPFGINVIARNVALTYALAVTPFTLFWATRHGPTRLRRVLAVVAPYLLAAGASAAVVTWLIEPRVIGPWRGLFAFAVSYAIFLTAALASPPDRRMLMKICQAGLRRI